MPGELDELYARVAEELTARAGPLWAVALALHRDPEPSFEEVRAARMLTGHLERGRASPWSSPPPGPAPGPGR
ncbi:hypothetical protein ACFV3E_34925 [Streptomyces sp. NPDC059718]